MTVFKLFFDGACKNNGKSYAKSSAGCLIKYGEEVILKISAKLNPDIKTNNEAEFCALLIGLKNCKDLGIKTLYVYGDSETVIKGMNEEKKIKAENLVPLYEECLKYANSFKKISFQHIYREFNSEADQLANNAF